MAVAQGGEDLAQVAHGLVLREVPGLDEVVEELAALDVLEHEVELAAVLPDVVELDDVGMLDQLHDDDLAFDAEGHLLGPTGILVRQALALHAGPTLDRRRRRLGDDLDGGRLAGDGVPGLAHPSRRSASQRGSQLPRADVRLSTRGP